MLEVWRHESFRSFVDQGEERIAVLFFIEDGFICGTSRKVIEDFDDHIKTKFEIGTLPAGRFLGMTINRDRVKGERASHSLTSSTPC